MREWGGDGRTARPGDARAGGAHRYPRTMTPPIGTPGPQQSPQDPAVARRNRAFALGGGAVVALLVIAAVVALVLGGRHGDPEKAAASPSLLPAPSSVPNPTMPGTATPPSATASPTLPPPTSTGMTGRGPGGLPADPKAMHLSAGARCRCTWR